MNREQAKQNLITLGIAEPTEEAVTNYLNQVNGESKLVRERADKYKADADKAAELQKALDALNEQNMSDIDKANKATETANNRVSELEKQIKAMELKTKLAEKQIIGEQADKLIESLSNGAIDIELLGQIITDRETNAVNAKIQEIANGSTNPGGGNNGGTDNQKSEAEKIAEGIGKSMGESNKASADIISSYLS